MRSSNTCSPNLHAFIDSLRQSGELAEIDAEVDPYLEVAEIHRRVIAANGPALLFKHVKGSPFPLVTNLFGSEKRVELAFGPRPFTLTSALARLPHTLLPPSVNGLWENRSLLGSLARVGVRRVRGGAVTECQSAPALTRLPVTTSWKKDGGPFFTLPLVYTEHPETGISNLGIYRMQRFDDASTGMHWQIGKGGGFHYVVAEQHQSPLPANVFLGGPPALMLAAMAPLPENIPELLLASLLLGKRVRQTRRDEVPLPLLADAEFALVGDVPPHERRLEGPFGDHYGYYSLAHDYPVFHCRRLYHRKDAIFPATVVGKPRQEDFYLGNFVQELLSPFFPLAMPSVTRLWSYGETGYHALSAAVIKERYRKEAFASACRILGEGQLSLTKFLLLTDKPVDLKDFKAVLTHILARARFETDLVVLGNTSMDSLDYAGPRINEGSKAVLLGLGDPVRDLPTRFQGEVPPRVNHMEVFSPGCLVVDGPSYRDHPEFAENLIAHPTFAEWPLLVLVDDAEKTTKSSTNFLWTTFTRFEPATDIHARKDIARNSVAFHPPIVIDARMKPSYPEELFCDPDTARLVARRWREYFPDRHVEMGDSDRGHLD